MKISDNTSISMPMRNLISILGAVAIGVWGYFGLVERLTLLEMQNASLMKDLEHAEDRLTADIDKNNEYVFTCVLCTQMHEYGCICMHMVAFEIAYMFTCMHIYVHACRLLHRCSLHTRACVVVREPAVAFA